MFDVNVYQENMFHTKMHIKDFDLDTYLFEAHADDLSFKERQRIENAAAARDRGAVPRPQPDVTQAVVDVLGNPPPGGFSFSTPAWQ